MRSLFIPIEMDREKDYPLEIVAEKPATSPREVPLLFVHGMCHAAWCWEEFFLPYFADHGYPSYALSLQGHGKSESPKRLRSLSLADYVSDISEAVDRIGTPPVLVGHSLGGLVVQKYLETRRAPAALLLASVPPGGILRSTVRFAFRRPLAFIRMNLTLSLYPLVETPEHCRNLLFSEDLPEDRIREYQSRMQDESYRVFWDSVGLNLPDPGRVKTPVLVLGAENDRVITVEENRETARSYDTEAEIFPDMAHDMMLESGWQNVAARIREWLESMEL